MRPPDPTVSVIVVSYNRAEDLRLSLEAIRGSTLRDQETIVVDNASADHARDVARSFGEVRLVENGDNRGFAAANNQGLALARGRYVALVNNDAVLDSRWLELGVKHLDEDGRLAGVGGKFFLWNDEQPAFSRDNHFYGPAKTRWYGDTPQDLDDPSPAREVATLNGAGVLIRREAIEAVGGDFLDPTFFMYFEETDFFARCIRSGWRLRYEPAMECWHRVRASTASVPYRYYYYITRNLGIFAARHFSVPALTRTRFYLATQYAKARAVSSLRPSDLSEERKATIDAWRWLSDHEQEIAADRARYFPGWASYQSALRGIARRNSRQL